jgi:broad specificity polyphosphatase/5'/3'-nucleotidase SurE
VLNVNFPNCTSGSTRGVVPVPLRTTRVTGYTLTGSMGNTQTFTPILGPSAIPIVSNCLSTVTDPATDVDGLTNGFATLTPLNPDLTVSQEIRGFRFLLR